MAVSSLTIHVIVKLVLGGLNYIFCKAALDLLAEGDMTKPGIMTLSAFFSLFIVGLPLYVQEIKTDRETARKENTVAVPRYSWGSHWLSIIPGVLEWIAMYLSMSANSYLPATIMVFMKATRVLWSALLTKYLLHRKLYGYHWLGVALTFVGLGPIILVQSMEVSNTNVSTATQVIAFACVFACEFFRAIRVILEERLLKEKEYSPEFVQYVEGYIGVILSILALVVLQFSGREDTMDSLEKLGSNGYALLFFTTHTIVHGLVNYSSNVVTKVLSSVHNAIISEMRIMIVWGPEFVIGWLYTAYNLHGILYKGKKFCALKLVDIPGFIIIAASAFIYSGKLKVPMRSLYPEELVVVDKGNDIEKVASPTTNDCCSEKACTH